MANTLITPQIIAKEALMQLRNNMVMARLVHRDYKKEFVKVGNTVTIRKPVKFTASDGAQRVNQDVAESSTSIVISKQKHVSWEFSSQDLTMTIEKYSERYIQPAGIALANIVDSDLCDLYKDTFMKAGTAATTPAAFSTLGAAAQRMDEAAVPNGQRTMVLNPAATWSMADALKSVYNEGIVKDMIREGKLKTVAGFDIYGNQNIKSHTKGTAGTITVNGASQVGSTVNVSAGSAGTFVKGDIITMAGCNSVNPISGESTGNLQEFVVTANSASGASHALAIYPSIITSGAYKTVSASPTTGGAVTLIGTHAANLAFHKNAFALVMVPMELPDGAPFKARETHDDISIRVVKDYDIDADKEVIRLDILYGVKTLYPELAVRLLG